MAKKVQFSTSSGKAVQFAVRARRTKRATGFAAYVQAHGKEAVAAKKGDGASAMRSLARAWKKKG